MVSIINIAKLEENLKILFMILDNKEKLEEILVKGQYDFYAASLMEYLESYSPEQTSQKILIKAVDYLSEIFVYVLNNFIGDKSVESDHQEKRPFLSDILPSVESGSSRADCNRCHQPRLDSPEGLFLSGKVQTFHRQQVPCEYLQETGFSSVGGPHEVPNVKILNSDTTKMSFSSFSVSSSSFRRSAQKSSPKHSFFSGPSWKTTILCFLTSILTGFCGFRKG